jgi:hypothetical protein
VEVVLREVLAGVRKALPYVLMGIGVFGIVLAFMLPFYVVPHSKKTPLDLDITTVANGTAQLVDPATGQPRTTQLRATRHVRTDSHASDSKNTTVDESVCIMVVQGDTPECADASDPRLLSVTTDRVTGNRKSGESVHVDAYNENVDGDPVRHAGLSYKWPIDAKKKTYQFYLPNVRKAFPAVYQGSSKLRGLTVYQYVSASGPQPYQINGLPGTLDDTRTVFVEPQTGVIVKGIEHILQKLDTGPTVLETTLTFDDKTIDFQANYAKKKINQLNFAGIWAPLIAGLVGLAAIAGAMLLWRRGRKQPPPSEVPPPPPAPEQPMPPTYAPPPASAGVAPPPQPPAPTEPLPPAPGDSDVTQPLPR